MANNNFNNINEFIDAFTKKSPYEKGLTDDCWFGIEFKYHNKCYRLTRDQSGTDEFTAKVRERFNKPNGYIELYKLPKENHNGKYELTVDIFLGIFDDINDLLKSRCIEGRLFSEIIVSSDTFVFDVD